MIAIANNDFSVIYGLLCYQLYWEALWASSWGVGSEIRKILKSNFSTIASFKS